VKHPETDDMTTPMTKLYDKDRRPWDLEPHYCRHTSAMTEEELHTKADIAKELAFRDQQIARLRASFECYNAEWHAEALRDNDRLRETVRKREQEHLDACAEADELRAEVARLTKLLDVCDVTHTHNVALKDERDRLRLLLGRVVKYVVEDRATTPRATRLARLVDEIRVELQHTGALEEDARLVATSKIQTKEPDETDDQYRSR